MVGLLTVCLIYSTTTPSPLSKILPAKQFQMKTDLWGTNLLFLVTLRWWLHFTMLGRCIQNRQCLGLATYDQHEIPPPPPPSFCGCLIKKKSPFRSRSQAVHICIRIFSISTMHAHYQMWEANKPATFI